MRGLLLILCPLLLPAGVARANLPAEAGEAFKLAQTLYQQGEHPQAIATLEPLREDHPQSADIHRLLGHVYAAAGQPARARDSLTEALRLGGLRVDALARLVQIDRQQDRPLPLLATLRLLTLLDPSDANWPRLTARTLAELGRSDEAAEVVQQVIERSPAEADALAQLGQLRLTQGRQDEAVVLLETAWQLGDAPPGLARTIGDIWLAAGDATRALTWYDRPAAASTGPSLQLHRARAWFELGELGRARQAAQQAAAEGGAAAGQAHRLLARLALEAGDAEAAAQHLEQADGPAELLAALGRHHYNEGDFARAADYLGQALSTDIDRPRLHVALVDSLIEVGRNDDAQQQLAAYVARQGMDDEAKRLAARLRSHAQP
ncbi:MAG: tetratricopeptide repeat protein [Phycisphaeraceae bacterium]